MIATDKITAVRRVLLKRIAVVDKIRSERPDYCKDYYEGKREGYRQAYDLLGESLASINIELEEDEHLH